MAVHHDRVTLRTRFVLADSDKQGAEDGDDEARTSVHGHLLERFDSGVPKMSPVSANGTSIRLVPTMMPSIYAIG